MSFIMPQEFKFTKHIYNLSPAICAVVVMATILWLDPYLGFDTLDLNKLNLPAFPAISTVMTKQMASRIGWGTSLFIYYLAVVTIMSTSIITILNSLRKSSTLIKCAVLLFTSIASIVACTLFNFERITVDIITDLMNKYLDESINLLIWADICGTTSIIFVLAAACTILCSEREYDESETLHSSEQGKNLMRLLYVASFFLVAGTFEIKMCLDYLLTYVVPEDNYDKMKLLVGNLDQDTFNRMSASYKVLKEVADTTRAMTGCIYTALLAAMYLPASMIIESRISGQDKTASSGADAIAMPPAFTRMLNLVAGIAPIVMGTSLDFLGKIKLG